jgi:hypothetical protein
MKNIKFRATEKNTDHLFQVIGTDNIDNYLNNLIERDIKERVENGSRKQY